MTWTDDQKALREAVTALGGVLSEGHAERDRGGRFGRRGWKHLSESGLFGLPFAERHGGLGQDLLTTMYVLEGLGYACHDAGLSFSASTHLVSVGVPVDRFGTEEIRDRILPGICDGSTIGAHAITEPEGGSDIMSMRTTAVRDGDEYVIDGSKAFVSNGPIADLTVVYARTGRPGSPAALTAFLVERGTPGLNAGPVIEKMGLRSSPLSPLFLDGVRVPANRVLGAPGSGFLVLDHVMRWEILCSFAITLGEMQSRLEECVAYARSRVQFGSHIGAYQSVSNRIVDMRIETETARKWLYDTGRKVCDGEDTGIDVAIAKLVTSEAAVRTALAAVQVFGGYGYTTEYGLERQLRDSVGGMIYSGTSDIQRQRIAALMGLHRAAPTLGMTA